MTTKSFLSFVGVFVITTATTIGHEQTSFGGTAGGINISKEKKLQERHKDQGRIVDQWVIKVVAPGAGTVDYKVGRLADTYKEGQKLRSENGTLYFSDKNRSDTIIVYCWGNEQPVIGAHFHPEKQKK